MKVKFSKSRLRAANSLYGLVKSIVADNQIKFYEITTIAEEESTLTLIPKHFQKDLKC
ncbi:hypothetical protein MASR2M41_11490 [Flammeovirgaceae bacterium]